MQDLNWDDLKLLIAVARHASLQEAGRTLGLATTTLSRRLAGLERAVGAQLIHRSHAGTRLTPAGQRLLDAITPLSLALQASLRDSAGADAAMAGPLRLALVEGLLPRVMEAIQSFRCQHPGVSFELDGGFRSVDMSRGEADLALRTLRPASEGLVLRRVGRIAYGVYRSSTGPQPRGALAAQLARSEGVLLGGEQLGLKESRWLRAQVRGIALQTPTLESLVDAVRRGIGVGVLPDALAAGDAGLRRLGDCEAVPHKTLWLVMNRRSAQLARVRAFADHVSAHLRAALPAEA